MMSAVCQFLDSAHGHDPELFARQIDLEAEMRSLGIDEQRRKAEAAKEAGGETRLRPVRGLMPAAHAALVSAIGACIAGSRSSRPGRKGRSLPYLEAAKPEVAAHLALRCVLDGISQRRSLTEVAERIGALIEDEARFGAFKAAAPALHRAVAGRLRGRGGADERHRRRVMVGAMNRDAARRGADADAFSAWPVKDKVALGVKLIELMVEHTGLVVATLVALGRGKTARMIEATPRTLAWLASEQARTEALAPLYLPTLVPPKPWVTPTGGGYYSDRLRALRLVKVQDPDQLAAIAAAPMPAVYAAVNAMQETAWQINRPVLDVMRALWDADGPSPVLPARGALPLPPRPAGVPEDVPAAALPEHQRALLSAWRKAAASIHDANHRLVQKRLAWSRMLWVAARFEEEEEFYFPHQLDFRGRAYAVPPFLNPQGADPARALLQFANVVPIGDAEGADWLAIHGANCFGLDKASFAERLAWVDAHDDPIRAVAADPLGSSLWTRAERPWQFLAFCFDWAGYRREGHAWLSALPVQMDGSCNGLQNFSAMLRDEIGGAAVNLLPSERPADIYQLVADAVSPRISADAGSADPAVAAVAALWAGRVDRGVCKRPVMTLPYGATRIGFRDQVYEDTVRPLIEADPAGGFADRGRAAANYLADVLWDGVGAVVVAARAAMDWLQAVARIVAALDRPIAWTTPAGLPVQQSYRREGVTILALTFQKVRLELAVATRAADRPIDRRRQQAGISPNWIHSLDAAHLQRTVLRCAEEGLRSFSLIHDSYGTHAGNAWLLARTLREEFVRMYRDHDVLAEFRDALLRRFPGLELPPLPAKGGLDLARVLDSPFFFA